MTSTRGIRGSAAVMVGASLMMLAAAIAAPAQTFTLLHDFDYTDGANPLEALVQATDGNLYGTTYYGGAGGDGTVFKITPSGSLTTLYNFCLSNGCVTGVAPDAPLIQNINGNFYGSTASGGAGTGSYGTVFRLASGGNLTTLHSFNGKDGNLPVGRLVQATDGNLYGTTEAGGAYGGGTVFRITSAGKMTTIYSFCPKAGCADGSYRLPAGVSLKAVPKFTLAPPFSVVP